MKSERFLSEVDLYHNPDPLFRLIGKPNELEVFINDRKIAALVDSGAQLSSISISLAKMLEMEVKSLRTILDLGGTGGLTIPYLGSVETRLWIPEVKAFDRDVLMLVVPDSSYCNRVPIALGTIHIDMLIKLATQEELGKHGHCWKRGAVLIGDVIQQAQLVSRKSLTDQINNGVKLTKNVTIRPWKQLKLQELVRFLTMKNVSCYHRAFTN